MPVEYEIDKRHGIVYTRASGELSDEEAFAHQRRLKKDPDFDPTARQLLDFSSVTHFRISPEAIRTLASKDPWTAGARRAFVAPQDLSFGMARMHQVWMADDSKSISVFRNLSEARQWLGLEDNMDT